MASENAVGSFLDLLRQSDLVSDDQMLALMVESSGAEKGPEGAQKLADELVKREVLTAWQADMLLQGKHRGFHLGPYRILRPLGQGGMSKVFLGEHKVMRRCCAIKVLPAKYEEDPDLLNRFQLEARAIAALDHPNIVRAYDFNKDVRYGKDMHYLVMEYVDGPDLRRMVDEQGPLDYRKAADFICQAAEGLAHAHAQGFVHRDIKPANLLVDPHGVLKVLDLGLARFNFEAEQGLNTSEGSQSAVGTADYIAPEQIVDSRHVDGRADIYSLGHTFYFLLTGHRPFTKPTIMELLMAHRAEEPEPIGKTRPDVPIELEAIIGRMTAKSPVQRYQTAKEVAETLRTWLNESGSGRGFSRISALMAEAMRAKQLAGQDTTRMKSTPTEDTDLELVSLDDEPTRSRRASGAKTADSDRNNAAKAAAADAKDKDRPSSPKNGSSPGMKTGQTISAKGEPADGASAPGGAQPASAGDEAALPSIRADLLSAPLADALAKEALPAQPLPAATPGQSQSQAMAALKRKEPQKSDDTAMSPWFWGSLAALGLLVLVSSSFILFGWSSTDKDTNHSKADATPPPRATTPEPTAQLTNPKPEPVPAAVPKVDGTGTPQVVPISPSPQPVVEKTPVPSQHEQPGPKATSDTATTAVPPVSPMPKQNHGKQPAAAKSVTSATGDDDQNTYSGPPKHIVERKGDPTAHPKPPIPLDDTAKPAVTSGLPAPGPDADKRPQQVQTPPKPVQQGPKEEVVDKEALLGGMTTIKFGLKKPFDGRLDSQVQAQAIAAAKELKLTLIQGDDAAVMEIELKTINVAEVPSVEMSAELKCPTPSGKSVTVWTYKRPIFTPKSGRVKLTPPLPPGVWQAMRPPVKEFFDKFVEDVRAAQAKVGAN